MGSTGSVKNRKELQRLKLEALPFRHGSSGKDQPDADGENHEQSKKPDIWQRKEQCADKDADKSRKDLRAVITREEMFLDKLSQAYVEGNASENVA